MHLSNPLIQLRPTLDKSGILRVNSRIRGARFLHFDAKCPILLHKNHPFTTLLIKHTHERILNHVGGLNQVLSHINKRFWITHGREAVKKALKGCVRCRQLFSQPRHQMMAPLPDFRITDSSSRLEPFHSVGIDCAGPFLTKQPRGRARQKRYLLIFVCCQYRAVHLEMIDSLDTASFLLAFSRFVVRRTKPVRIISDNGTNFKRGEEELKTLWQAIEEDDEIKSQYPTINWWYNTPSTPHSGGHFERLIKAAKLAFYAVAPAGDLRDEELRTLFTGVEGYLNNRPLTYSSTDASDLTPLTPNHFLRGEAMSDIAPVPVQMSNQTRWHYIQKVLDQHWQRFIREYIPMLQKNKKWDRLIPIPAKGDFVVVLEDRVRGLWPLGRVVELCKANETDQLPRAAVVMVRGRTLKRPLHKLIPLQKEETN